MDDFKIKECVVEETLEKARIAKVAADEMAKLTNEQIDKILKNIVDVVEENAYFLGLLAHEETGFGNAHDKAYKNHMASYLLYQEIKDLKTVGVIREDLEKKIIEVAHPVGLIMGIVPSTNPTSTVIYNSIIAIKSGNAIIFSPHPSAIKSGKQAAELINEAAEKAGAPKNVVSILDKVSLDATKALMEYDDVKLIIATGGPGMVKSAYSSGKPAIGVGAGNSPAYIEKTANVKEAVEKIFISKTFDYGTICASEQSIVCEESNFEEVVKEVEKNGGYFLNKDEIEKVANVIFNPGSHSMNAKFVGRSAKYIAEHAGIKVPEGTKVLVGPQAGVGENYPLSYEKLTCVLGFYVVKDWKEACELCFKLLEHGMGHTLSVHTENPEIVLKFSVKPASRIIINSGGATGGTGLTTNLGIAFTLGCGTCGGSSVSENVGPQHLINIKKVAFESKNPKTVIQQDEKFQKDVMSKVTNPTCCYNEPKTLNFEKTDEIKYSDEQIANAIRQAIYEIKNRK